MEQINTAGRTTTLVHFTHDVGGRYCVACMPDMIELHQTLHHPNYQRSNDVRAVTCPACKKSTVFLEIERIAGAASKK